MAAPAAPAALAAVTEKAAVLEATAVRERGIQEAADNRESGMPILASLGMTKPFTLVMMRRRLQSGGTEQGAAWPTLAATVSKTEAVEAAAGAQAAAQAEALSPVAELTPPLRAQQALRPSAAVVAMAATDTTVVCPRKTLAETVAMEAKGASADSQKPMVVRVPPSRRMEEPEGVAAAQVAAALPAFSRDRITRQETTGLPAAEVPVAGPSRTVRSMNPARTAPRAA